MPAVKIFIDSNVLLYSRDKDSEEKSSTSNTWISAAVKAGAARTNLQVLNEVTNVMLRKRRDLPNEAVFSAVDEIRFLGQSPVTEVTVRQARTIRQKTSYSWWDCLLLASALELGCTHFLSEDLADGQKIEGLTIIDPFAHSPDQILIPR
jgi:predicted nucleic acid-binding protein